MSILIISTFLLVLSACDMHDDVDFYQESVEGLYGDGINIVGTVVPLSAVSEYTDLPRVQKNIVFDTRITGWHNTGIFVVKGEKIKITIPQDKVDDSIVATVARYSQDSYSVVLDDQEVYITSPVSGLLDINLGDCRNDEFWQINIYGGISSVYYRLGIDSTDQFDKAFETSVIDSGNVRIYLDFQALPLGESLKSVAIWWRSFTEYLDKKLIGEFGITKTSPTDIFVGGTMLSFDDDNDIVRIPAEYASEIVNYDSLTQGKLWDIMHLYVKHKIADSPELGKEYSNTELVDIVCAGAYIELTNGILLPENSDMYWVNNAYDCLKMTIDNGLSQYANLSLYVNLMHSFGSDIIVTTAISSFADNSLYQAIYDEIAKTGYDVSEYLNTYYEVAVEKSKQTLIEYIPIQSKYATGNVQNTNQSGVKVNSGEVATFDFANAVVTTAQSTVLNEEKLLSNGLWTKNQDGTFSIKPADNAKYVDFSLEYNVDGQTSVLYGRLTCNLTVSVFQRYENVPYRDLDTAINEYTESGSSYLTQTKALSTASIPQNTQENDSIYTFSVNEGAIEVDETAVYKIYIKSKGMVRVDFGVNEYMFTMFENSLTVQDYTDELCYEIELQKGEKYYYDIYILATKGNAYATLGIAKADGDVKDVDGSYLIYYPFERSDISEFEVVQLKPDVYSEKKEIKQSCEPENWIIQAPETVDNSKLSYITDGDKATVYKSVSQDKHIFVFDCEEIIEFDYFDFYLQKSDNINYALYISDNNIDYNIIGSGKAKQNTLIDFESTQNARYIKLVLTSADDKSFSSTLSDVACGTYAQSAQIIPSNSSRVLYQGKWQYKTGGISVNGWLLESYGNDPAIEFNFYGTSISLYCAKGVEYGDMQIYVDGKLSKAVSLSSSKKEYDVQVFTMQFQSAGEHSIRIVPASNDDIINIDYLTVVYAQKQEVAPDMGNLWYFAVIPAIIFVVFVICIAMDIGEKAKKKRKRMQ